MRHLIDFGDLPRTEWDGLYSKASEIIDHPEEFLDACHGKLMASLFYEPSTRTNFSFQAAMMRLGGSVFGFADPKSSSVAKGETLKDTIKMVSGYADVVVMRNPREGAAKAASLYSHVPVVNAGDGGHMQVHRFIICNAVIALRSLRKRAPIGFRKRKAQIGQFRLGAADAR
ncbi:MAG: hypothetical protein RRY64_05445, partial [Oscillospiraceae bacterium]